MASSRIAFLRTAHCCPTLSSPLFTSIVRSRVSFASSYARQGASNAATKNTAAKTAPHKAQSARLPSSPSLNAGASTRIGTPTQQRSQAAARQLFDAKQTVLFRAPSHVSFLAGSYLLGIGCFTGTIMMALSEHWKEQSDGLPFFVPIIYRVSMFFLTMLGGWIVLRSARQIIGIDLVSGVSGGGVKTLVTIRRAVPLPFLQPKKIVTEPSDFMLPSRMVAQLAIPGWAEPMPQNTGNILSRLSNSISQKCWSVFAGNRKIFTQEGFMDISINGNPGSWKLDTSGYFLNDGKALISISGFDR